MTYYGSQRKEQQQESGNAFPAVILTFNNIIMNADSSLNQMVRPLFSLCEI